MFNVDNIIQLVSDSMYDILQNMEELMREQVM